MNIKKMIALLVLLLSISGLEASNTTVIKFDKTIHDFGEIREDKGPVAVRFTFKNIGKNTYKIKQVITTCGCTTFDYTKEEVKKGKSGFVTLIFDPANYTGDFSKIATVKGNTNRDIKLIIKGKVIPKPHHKIDDFKYSMGVIRAKKMQILAGKVFPSKLDTIKIEFYNQSNTPVRFTGLEAPAHIVSDYLPVEIQPKSFGIVEIYYSAYQKGDVGYVFDNITFHTNDARMPDKVMTVVANIIDDYANMTEEELANAAHIELSTYEHDFGKVHEGKVLSQEVTMYNTGKSKLVIYDLQTDCGCTATTLGKRKLDAGESATFRVVFHTKDKPGQQNRVVTIKTNDPDREEVTFTIKAYVIPNPDLKDGH